MKIQGTPQQGLLGATLGFFIGFAAVALFGPTANKLKDLMHLTPVTVGFLVAMPSLSGSLLRIPFAAWVDTVGGRKPFLVLLGTAVLGMLGLTILIYLLYPNGFTAGLLPLLFLLGILCGAGIATFSVGTGQVSYWFPRGKQGSALGTYAGVGNLAPGIFSFLLPVALSGLGMFGSYLAWLVFLVVGTFLYYRLGRNAPYFQFMAQGKTRELAVKQAGELGQESFPGGNFKTSLLASAQAGKTWLLVAIYFTTFGGFLALTSWLPVYWKSFLGVEAVAAGSLAGLYSILASLCRVAGGRISDKLGGEKTLVLSLAITCAGAVFMTFSHQFGVSLIGEIVMAVGMGVSNSAVFKLVPQAVPQAVGGTSGWVGGLGAFGGFTIPPVLGAIVASQGASSGYARGFGIFIALSLVSLVMTYLLSRTPEKRVRSQRVMG
jgi:NNP family nitrate/nitrite transporter-like MFS transporter